MSMQKCIFKFTVITLHLEQQSNVKNTVKNCKLYYSYSTVLCTFLKCVPYLQCSSKSIRMSDQPVLFGLGWGLRVQIRVELGRVGPPGSKFGLSRVGLVGFI